MGSAQRVTQEIASGKRVSDHMALLPLTNLDAIFGRGRKVDEIRKGSLYRSLIEIHATPYSALTSSSVANGRTRTDYITTNITSIVTRLGGRFIMRQVGQVHALVTARTSTTNRRRSTSTTSTTTSSSSSSDTRSMTVGRSRRKTKQQQQEAEEQQEEEEEEVEQFSCGLIRLDPNDDDDFALILKKIRRALFNENKRRVEMHPTAREELEAELEEVAQDIQHQLIYGVGVVVDGDDDADDADDSDAEEEEDDDDQQQQFLEGEGKNDSLGPTGGRASTATLRKRLYGSNTNLHNNGNNHSNNKKKKRKTNTNSSSNRSNYHNYLSSSSTSSVAHLEQDTKTTASVSSANSCYDDGVINDNKNNDNYTWAQYVALSPTSNNNNNNNNNYLYNQQQLVEGCFFGETVNVNDDNFLVNDDLFSTDHHHHHQQRQQQQQQQQQQYQHHIDNDTTSMNDDYGCCTTTTTTTTNAAAAAAAACCNNDDLIFDFHFDETETDLLQRQLQQQL